MITQDKDELELNADTEDYLLEAALETWRESKEYKEAHKQ